jgi:hypothetical protein
MEEAAREVGLSDRQRNTAVAVAKVPQAEFEELVESAKPPTVTKLAELGRKNANRSSISKDESLSTSSLQPRCRVNYDGWQISRGVRDRNMLRLVPSSVSGARCVYPRTRASAFRICWASFRRGGVFQDISHSVDREVRADIAQCFVLA